MAAGGGGGGATGLTIAAGGTDGGGAACFGGGGGACGGANRAAGICGCGDAGLAIGEGGGVTGVGCPPLIRVRINPPPITINRVPTNR